MCRVFIAAWVFLYFQQAGPTLVAVHGLLIVVSSLVVEHGSGCVVSVFVAPGCKTQAYQLWPTSLVVLRQVDLPNLGTEPMSPA